VLAFSRVLLALTSLIVWRFRPAAASSDYRLGLMLLAGYTLHGLVLLAFLQKAHKANRGLVLWMQTSDIVWPALLCLFTDAPNSIFFIFFLFAMIAAAFRWGFVETMATAEISAALLLCQAVLVAYGPPWLRHLLFTSIEPTRIIMRCGFLVMAGFLLGFLAENVALYHRRAERLIKFYGALNRMGGSQLERRTQQVLEMVGLRDQAKRNVGKFSRGMLQRIGLAQAIVNDPELLILDEPTSALDPVARVAVRELLLGAREAGKTIFLSSHLLSEVELICDRVAVLHRGKLRRLGKTTDLLHTSGQTEIVACGIPATNINGAVAHDGLVTFCVPTSAQREALERVWNSGGEVISVNPVRATLEQIFLEVTADPQFNSSQGAP
jgi:ABC-2 type transport system ATP-binding protein